jgi:tRNA threonylcarbamoyladenosine biosynthesis protein TsaE
MRSLKIHSQKIANSVAMKKFAAEFAREIAGSPLGTHAKVVGLIGNLGAGKTTFAQGFLKELGVKRRVISPTFLIVRNYKLKDSQYGEVFHIDCYRLRKPQELISLGFEALSRNPANIVLIEWPELIKKYLPRDTRWITIEHPEKGTHRTVRFMK